MGITILWIPSIILFGSILYLIVVLLDYLNRGKFHFWHFNFSRRNFYIMMLPFVLASISESVILRSLSPILIFILFGIAGVIGEVI